MGKKSTISLRDIFSRFQASMLVINLILLFAVVGGIVGFSMKNHAYHLVQVVGLSLRDRLEPAMDFQEQGFLAEELSQTSTSEIVKYIRLYDEKHQFLLESQRVERPYGFVQDFFDAILYEGGAIRFPFYTRAEPKTIIGYLEIHPSSQYIITFILQVLLGLCIVFTTSVILAWYGNARAYRRVIHALAPLLNIATLIHDNRAYNLRFPQSNIREINLLTETFNQILSETEKWSSNIQQENEKLSYKAYHDELTGLANRHVFHQRLQTVFSDPMLRKSSALIFVDCNRFKKINDTYGHQAGDAVLREAANRLRARVRNHDLIARLGGDEFAIILYSIYKMDYLVSIAQHIMAGSEEPIIFDGEEIYFGFSMGVAFSEYAVDSEAWIEQADKAMYHAKFLDQHWAIYKPQMGDE